MTILNKIFTAIRGGATKTGESIVDANATLILEQEIRDAETSMGKAKHDLTDIMAQSIKSHRQIERIKQTINEYEQYAIKALEQKNESLATDIANKIAHLEQELQNEDRNAQLFDENAERLKGLLIKCNQQVADYKRQLSIIKTTDSVQKATSSITENFSSSTSKLLNAKSTLERIKAKQEAFNDRMVAAEQLNHQSGDSDLETKLKSAGISESDTTSQDVLARLKARQKKSNKTK